MRSRSSNNNRRLRPHRPPRPRAHPSPVRCSPLRHTRHALHHRRCQWPCTCPCQHLSQLPRAPRRHHPSQSGSTQMARPCATPAPRRRKWARRKWVRRQRRSRRMRVRRHAQSTLGATTAAKGKWPEKSHRSRGMHRRSHSKQSNVPTRRQPTSVARRRKASRSARRINVPVPRTTLHPPLAWRPTLPRVQAAPAATPRVGCIPPQPCCAPCVRTQQGGPRWKLAWWTACWQRC